MGEINADGGKYRGGGIRRPRTEKEIPYNCLAKPNV